MTDYHPVEPPEETHQRPLVPPPRRPPTEPPQAVPAAEHPRSVPPPRTAADELLLERAVLLIYFAFGVLEAGLILRFVLKLIGANPNNAFALLVYGLTEPFTFLFSTLVPNPAAGPFVVEITTLVAMLFYWLLAWGIVRFLWLVFARRPA